MKLEIWATDNPLLCAGRRINDDGSEEDIEAAVNSYEGDGEPQIFEVGWSLVDQFGCEVAVILPEGSVPRRVVLQPEG